MKAIMIIAVTLLPTMAYANSDARHDRRLEQAAAEIVASRIGDIRGGFLHDEQPVRIGNDRRTKRSLTRIERRKRTSGPIWQNGLAPARAIPAGRRGNI